jgi:SAM-dependent methyltransferase
MIAQRPAGAAPAVQGFAEALPFADDSFEAALAVLTIHHWRDVAAGLLELRRVARRRIVILHWDPEVVRRFWLVAEYLPEIAENERSVPAPGDIEAMLGCPLAVLPVPVPHDCADGFLGAYWRRPETYLDPVARASISAFTALGEAAARGLERLRDDLESGAWARRHGDLLAREDLDVGYRLLVAG